MLNDRSVPGPLMWTRSVFSISSASGSMARLIFA